MNEVSQKVVIPVIVGATASGKSALARDLADRTGARIISVDSRKVYRRLDIGTAKPSPELIAKYDYGMVDIIDPDKQYSAYQFAQEATRLIGETIVSGRAVVLAGGTGLYLRALKDGLFEGPDTDPKIREKIRREAKENGWDFLREKLRNVDPLTAAQVDLHNIPRLERALEVYYLTGQPISSWQQQGEYRRPLWKFKLFAVERPRDQLYRRIELRTERMVAQGLFAEVGSLLAAGLHPDAPGLRSVGYAEVIEYLAGTTNQEQAVAKIKQNTRRFAKRQLTWFRNQEEICWLQPDGKMVQIILDSLSSD